MFEIKTKEHLAYFMQTGVMRLGKYDLRFVQNINHIALTKKPITTNQSQLFDKLVEKYNRQLAKHGITKNLINSLEWQIPIISSDPKHTEAFITIKEDKILFKAPFNKNFLSAFRKIEDNPFKWEREEKVYVSEFGTRSLKILVTVAGEIYPIVNYCPITTQLLNTLTEFDTVRYWNPTLVKLHDSYLIAAANDSLINATKHITLNSYPECLLELSRFGISIDDAIINDDPLNKFASKYVVEEDFVNIENLISWLTSLNCDTVIIMGVAMMLNHRKILQQRIRDAGIAIITNEVNTEDDWPFADANTFIINFSKSQSVDIPVSVMKRVKKIILLRNSTPIDIK
jgi:hypothetical protein